MTDQEKFEKIKEACLSEGGKLLLEQIKEHCDVSDTIIVSPATSEEMFSRYGYVLGLKWLQGLMVQYQELNWEENCQS